MLRRFLKNPQQKDKSLRGAGLPAELQHFIPEHIDSIAEYGFLSRFSLRDNNLSGYDLTRQVAEDRLLQLRLPHVADANHPINRIRPIYAHLIWTDTLEALRGAGMLHAKVDTSPVGVVFFRTGSELDHRTTFIRDDSVLREQVGSLRGGKTLWDKNRARRS